MNVKFDVAINHLHISHRETYDYVLSCSECKYQFDRLKKKTKKCKSTTNIPVNIFQIIKPTITGTDLSSDDLLLSATLK